MYSCEISQKNLDIQRFFIFRVQKEKNRNPDRMYQNYGSYLVEMTGIEPVSEKRLQRLSSSVVIVLKFPQLIAQRQAINLGILKVMTRYKALPCSRSPLIDAY